MMHGTRYPPKKESRRVTMLTWLCQHEVHTVCDCDYESLESFRSSQSKSDAVDKITTCICICIAVSI